MDFLSQVDIVLFEMISGNHQSWSSVLVWLSIFWAKFLIYIIPVHLCGLWFCGGYMNRCVVLSICVSMCTALFLGYLISCFHFRPRPFIAYMMQPMIAHKATASFPSNHALVIASYTFGFYFYRYKAAFRFALVMLFLICWGRVFTCVHYPFDVFAGVILGSFVSWVIIRFVSPYFPDFLYRIPPLKYNFKSGAHSK